MQTKLFEVLDRATFIPVMATLMVPGNEGQTYLLQRSGYHTFADELVLVTRIYGGHGESRCDPYDWGDSRTMQVAHDYIQRNFHALQDGDVIDVEFILGETITKKASERFYNG